MSGRTAGRDRIEAVASALCRVALEAHVELPVSYARRVATATIGRNSALDVSRLGTGIVIRTLPAAKERLPVVVGYADSRGQWYRDGSRHVESPAAEQPIEAPEIGL